MANPSRVSSIIFSVLSVKLVRNGPQECALLQVIAEHDSVNVFFALFWARLMVAITVDVCRKGLLCV